MSDSKKEWLDLGSEDELKRKLEGNALTEIVVDDPQRKLHVNQVELFN